MGKVIHAEDKFSDESIKPGLEESIYDDMSIGELIAEPLAMQFLGEESLNDYIERTLRDS